MAEDLKEGKSVVLVFPDSAVAQGVADAVLIDLSHETAYAEYCRQSGDPFPTRVLDTFGADTDTYRRYDSWNAIAGWRDWQGAWVVIPGWEHDDVEEIVQRWPAQAHASGLTADAQPKLVIGARLCDVPRTVLAHLDPSLTAVHWWWGVLDRLDTEIRLAAVPGCRLNPVEAAVITELACWDLACVDFLARHWDRTTAGAPAAVESYRRAVPAPVSGGPPSVTRRHSTAPPVDLEHEWRDGLVDRWGHTLRNAPATLDDKAITQRLWMAHNRVLVPHIDEERAEYEQRIRRKASSRALADVRRRDDDVIEIGSLAWLVDTGRVDLGRDHRRRLSAFRVLRNQLAHRVPVNDRLLAGIMAYLEF
ncbi:hypothetical protein AB0M34_22040 [Nocardia sp. NPDC050193]